MPDLELTTEEAKNLIAANAIFGSLFSMVFCATIAMIIRRKIEDLFIKYALVCLIIALFLSTIMCFIISTYKSYDYINEQSVPFQQLYFELPYYMFLIVLASLLFSWQMVYEELVLQCSEDEITNDSSPRHL